MKRDEDWLIEYAAARSRWEQTLGKCFIIDEIERLVESKTTLKEVLDIIRALSERTVREAMEREEALDKFIEAGHGNDRKH